MCTLPCRSPGPIGLCRAVFSTSVALRRCALCLANGDCGRGKALITTGWPRGEHPPEPQRVCSLSDLAQWGSLLGHLFSFAELSSVPWVLAGARKIMPLGLISPVWRGSGPTFPQPRLSTPVCEIPTETEVPAHTSRLRVGMLRALPRPPVFHGPGEPITALIPSFCTAAPQEGTCWQTSRKSQGVSAGMRDGLDRAESLRSWEEPKAWKEGEAEGTRGSQSGSSLPGEGR